MATKILLVEDDVFSRDGIGRYLREQGFDVCEADNAKTAWQMALHEKPAAAILDIVIPEAKGTKHCLQHSAGVKLMVKLKRSHPDLGIVLFSAYEDRGQVLFEILNEGVCGIAYKLKGCPPTALLKAIRAVMCGQNVIDPEVASKSKLCAQFLDNLIEIEKPWVKTGVRYIQTLTPRELDVAHRLAAAHTNKGVAAALQLTPKSVENYTQRIYQKLGLDKVNEVSPYLRKSVLLAKAFILYDLQGD